MDAHNLFRKNKNKSHRIPLKNYAISLKATAIFIAAHIKKTSIFIATNIEKDILHYYRWVVYGAQNQRILCLWLHRTTAF